MMQYWEGMAVSLCVAKTVAKARPVRVRGPFALVCALLLLLQCLIIPSQRMRDNNLYSELFRTLLDQYSFVACGIGKDLAQVRFDRAMEAINRNRDTIEEVGEYFGVPPENIAAVLLKEQFTRSAPDFLVVAFAPSPRIPPRKPTPTSTSPAGFRAPTSPSCACLWRTSTRPSSQPPAC